MHTIFSGLLHDVRLFPQEGVELLGQGARGIYNHKTVREHFLEFIGECVSSRRSDVAYTSAPSVHASFLPMFVRKTSRRSKGSSRLRSWPAVKFRRVVGENPFSAFDIRR